MFLAITLDLILINESELLIVPQSIYNKSIKTYPEIKKRSVYKWKKED
ncbi:hypothetical protein CLOM621_05018 [Clostridium sp. M62/1]|nr:hypothetical protein CLOM621_05018 [Clostridium sp. M62/1]